jgi:hypothetical protein
MTKKARVKGKSQVITIVLQPGLSIQLVNANKKGVATLSFTDDGGGTLTMNQFGTTGKATSAFILFEVNG